MLIRIAVFVMMSLGLLGFGTVAWLSTQTPTTNAGVPEIPMENIIVAHRDMRAGTLIKPDDLGVQRVPRENLVEGAVLDSPSTRRAIIGSMILRNIQTGNPLLSTDALRPGEHGFLAAVLAPGKRAVTVGVDAITGTAGLIWPGDHVDVLLTQQIDDPTRPLGRRTAGETVLTDVRVIAIDQQLGQGATPGATDSKPATTVTLEVSAFQAERVSVATRLGRLSLVVRAAQEDATKLAELTGTTISPGITWALDVSPAMAVEPPPQAATPPSVVRVYRGAGDGQEYKF